MHAKLIAARVGGSYYCFPGKSRDGQANQPVTAVSGKKKRGEGESSSRCCFLGGSCDCESIWHAALFTEQLDARVRPRGWQLHAQWRRPNPWAGTRPRTESTRGRPVRFSCALPLPLPLPPGPSCVRTKQKPTSVGGRVPVSCSCSCSCVHAAAALLQSRAGAKYRGSVAWSGPPYAWPHPHGTQLPGPRNKSDAHAGSND